MIELEEAFSNKHEKSITIGAEMEVYLLTEDDYDSDYYVLNRDDRLIEDIYKEMDERIYRDYYPFQLEIRTKPSDDPREVARELIELFDEVQRTCREYHCKIIPVSWIRGEMYNGMHVHIGYTPALSTKMMIKRAISAYPFILDVARLSLSSPNRTLDYGRVLSSRLLSEMHTGVMPVSYRLQKLEEMWLEDYRNDASCRYYDIIINAHGREGRHRLKDVVTTEVRIFDAVGSKRYIYAILELTYNIFKFINPDLFSKYRNSYDDRMRLEREFRVAREAMIRHESYINPVTGTDVLMLQNFFGMSSTLSGSWIYDLFWDWDEFCTVNFQSGINYLIR